MIQIVKKEWHQVTSVYTLDIDVDILGEIYPDKSEEELFTVIDELRSGDFEVADLVEAAMENDVSMDWDHQDDDWWTDRKGGYDVTFEVGG